MYYLWYYHENCVQECEGKSVHQNWQKFTIQVWCHTLNTFLAYPRSSTSDSAVEVHRLSCLYTLPQKKRNFWKLHFLEKTVDQWSCGNFLLLTLTQGHQGKWNKKSYVSFEEECSRLPLAFCCTSPVCTCFAPIYTAFTHHTSQASSQ